MPLQDANATPSFGGFRFRETIRIVLKPFNAFVVQDFEIVTYCAVAADTVESGKPKGLGAASCIHGVGAAGATTE